MTQIIQTGSSFSPLAQALSGLLGGANNFLKMKEQYRPDNSLSGILSQLLAPKEATLPKGFMWPGGAQNNPNTPMTVPDFLQFLQTFNW